MLRSISCRNVCSGTHFGDPTGHSSGKMVLTAAWVGGLLPLGISESFLSRLAYFLFFLKSKTLLPTSIDTLKSPIQGAVFRISSTWRLSWSTESKWQSMYLSCVIVTCFVFSDQSPARAFRCARFRLLASLFLAIVPGSKCDPPVIGGLVPASIIRVLVSIPMSRVEQYEA